MDPSFRDGAALVRDIATLSQPLGCSHRGAAKGRLTGPSRRHYCWARRICSHSQGMQDGQCWPPSHAHAHCVCGAWSPTHGSPEGASYGLQSTLSRTCEMLSRQSFLQLLQSVSGKWAGPQVSWGWSGMVQKRYAALLVHLLEGPSEVVSHPEMHRCLPIF